MKGDLFCLRWLLFALVAIGCQNSASAAPPDPSVLARQIDQRLSARFKQDKVEPAPIADDAEFLRRASLDITGRIPRVADVHEFLADRSPEKRRKLIDRLLDDPRYAHHFANVWRAELAPEIASDRGASVFQAGFEAWLRDQLGANVPYDRMVRELLTVPLSTDIADATPVLRDPERPNPIAFFAVKEAKPENLAAAVTRTFLGVRLECAQCHNHPFARWKQDQFWGQAAFFAAVKRQGTGMFAPLTEANGVQELAMEGGGKAKPVAYLDGTSAKSDRAVSPRAEYAAWVTSADNPFFAKAAANRMWGHFFGTGIVNPVDDFRDDNPPHDAKLLDELARGFQKSGFDSRWLIRSICLSEAYLRSSARTHASQVTTVLPAKMALKVLSGEQLFDSLALATGYRDDQDMGVARRQFLARFALTSSSGDPETSVQQALTLLNGKFVVWAVDADKCPTLIAVCQTPGLSRAERVEALYLATLSRKPTAAEQQRCDQFFGSSPTMTEEAGLSDLFWVLLNSVEFRLNH